MALNGLALPHLKDLLHPYIPAQTLCSQNAGLLIIPRVGKYTVGGRGFSSRAPLLWNDLPIDIHGADSPSSSLGSNLTYIANLFVEGHGLVLAWIIEFLVDEVVIAVTDCLGSPSCLCQSPASRLLVMLP